MKKLNKIINIKALLMVFATCVAVISASAQAVVSTATFPTGLVVGQEATFTYNASGFADGVTFILWHDANTNNDLDDDELILGTATVDDGTDQDIDFDVPSGFATLNMRFAGFTGSTQSEETTDIEASDVDVEGSDETGYNYTFDATSLRQLTTDPFDVSSTDPITLRVEFNFQNFDTDNPGKVQYSLDGFATAGVDLDFNGDAVAGGLEIEAADGTSFEFVLPSAAKSASTSFRIVQTGTINYGTGKSWSVSSIDFVVGDEYVVEAADYDNNVGTPDDTTPAFSNEAVTVPTITTTTAQDGGLNDVEFANVTVYPGDAISITGTVNGLAGITSGKGVVAVLRDPDGNEIGAIGSDATIDDVTEAFTITATIPASITYNSTDNWDILLKPFSGSSAELGLEETDINFTNLSDVANELEIEDFTIEGGEQEAGEGIVFDIAGDRSVTSPTFNITGTDGIIEIDFARKNDVISAGNTNVVIEYTTDGSAYTELTNQALNAFEVDNSSTTVSIEGFPSGMISSTTQIRIRQESNNGANLDAFIVRDFSIENESNIISTDEIAQDVIDNLDIERPVIAFDQINIDGGTGDGKAFPTESQTLTFDITNGAFASGSGASLYFDRDADGLETDFDLNLGSIDDITDESITFNVPPIDGGLYDLFLVPDNGEEYFAVSLTVFELDLQINSIDITDPITIGTTDFVNPGGSITVNYEVIEGSLGAEAKVMLKLLDDNGDYIMIGEEEDAATSGSITATIPFDFDYPAGSTQSVQLSVTNGDGVVNYDATVSLVDYDNFSLNAPLDEDIFETLVGSTPQGDGSDLFDQAGERSATTVAFDISSGATITSASFYVLSYTTPFTVKLEGSVNGTDWEEVDEVSVSGNFSHFFGSNMIPNSLQSSQTRFRIIYNEDGNLAANTNTIEIYDFDISVPEFLETANVTETFELIRPSLSVNTYDETDFIIEDDVTVNFNALAFPDGTEYAAVLRQGRGQADEEYVVLATGTVDGDGNGTLTGALPSVVPLGDNSGDAFDIEIIPFTPSTAGGDYVEGEVVTFNDGDDYLELEGTNNTSSTFTFNQVGERTATSKAIDLSTANGAELTFTTSYAFDINSNQNVVPRLEISTDGGATFNVVNVEDLAEGEDPVYATGLLYEARTYTVDIEVGNAETHFRFSQPLNVGASKNTWAVQNISMTIGDDNAINSGSYTTTAATNPQGVTVEAPSVTNFLFVQNDLQDPVFNSETFVASFDIKSELNPDNVPLYPSGTLFEFYIEGGSGIVIDPDTDLPLIIGSTTALGTFDATIPFYVTNDNYDVLVAVSTEVDGEKVYYVGDENSGTDVGDLDIFLRVVTTVVDFPDNDVLYGGESLTFSIDIENDETLAIDDSELFANLLVIDPFGSSSDDLLIATQQGTGDITVDLPTYLNGNQTFRIELTEDAPLGEVGEMVGSSNSLTNLENDENNFENEVDVSGGQVYFENDFGRGLITFSEFEAGDLTGKTLVSFDLTFGEAGEDILTDQFLIFEYSIDGGATYTELATYPEVDGTDPLVGEKYRIDVVDDMINNNSIFRFRQEERNNINVSIDNFSFIDAEVLPFEYVSADQSIQKQVLIATTTTIDVAEACFDDEVTIGYEARGVFGSDNVVQIVLLDVDNDDELVLVQEASIVSGTGELTLSLDIDEDDSDRSDLISEGDNNKSFRVAFNYDDETFIESIEDISDNDLSISSSSEVFSEGSVEIVAPINQDATVSVTSSTKLCDAENLIVNINAPQNYFMYEVINSDTDEVLGTLTYDPDLGETEVDLGLITEDIDLGLRITSGSSSGSLTCNTLVSSEINEVEFDENYKLFLYDSDFSVFDLVEAGQTITVCEGQGIELEVRRESTVASNPSETEWFRDNVNTPLIGSGADIFNNTSGINDRSGTYFARITDGDCVYTTESITIVIEEKPEKPEITVVSGNLVGCSEEDPVVLSAPDGFAYYQWNTGENTQTIEVELTVSGSSENSSTSRTVQVSNRPFQFTCGSASSDAVVIERYRNVDFNISTSSNIQTQILDGDELESCGSQLIYFHDEYINTTTSATFYGTVEIIRDGVVVEERVNTNHVFLDESGVYSFRYLNDGSGLDVTCSAMSESFTLTVYETPDRPEITVTSGTVDGCEGDGEVTLSAPSGFAYYLWTNGATTETITVDPSSTTNYRVQVSDDPGNETGCLSNLSNQITVTRNSVSDFAVRTSTSFNSGSTITDGETITDCDDGFPVYFFDGTSYTNGGRVEVILDGAVIASTTSSSYTLDQSGDYSFNWLNTSDASCTTSSVTFTLVLEATPAAPVLTTTDNLTFCEGEGSVTIDGPAGFAQYRWFRSGTEISSNTDGFGSTNSSITVSDQGVYTLEVSNIADEEACFSPRSNGIEVITRNRASDGVGINQIGELCGSGTASIQVTGTNQVYNYQLINRETEALVGSAMRGSSSGDPIFMTTEDISIDTEYYIQVSYADGEGCPALEVANAFTASVNNVVLELEGNTIMATVYGGYSDIEWFRNGVRLRNRSGNTSISITDAASYSVEVDFGDGCVIASNTIEVESGARITTNFDDLAVTSYPNPSAGKVSVSMTDGPLGTYSIDVVSLTGKVVLSRTIDKTENEHVETLDLGKLENGVYNVIVKRGNSIENVRVIKK